MDGQAFYLLFHLLQLLGRHYASESLQQPFGAGGEADAGKQEGRPDGDQGNRRGNEPRHHKPAVGPEVDPQRHLSGSRYSHFCTTTATNSGTNM